MKKFLLGLGVLVCLVSCEEYRTTSSGQYRPDVTRAEYDTARGVGEVGQSSQGNQRLPLSRGSDEFINEDALGRSRPSRADIEIV